MIIPILNAESVYRLLRFSPTTEEVDEKYIAHFLTPSKAIKLQNGERVPFHIPVHFFRARMMQVGILPSVHHDHGKTALGAALPALMQMAATRNTEIYIANRPISRTMSLFSDLSKAKQKTASDVLRALLHENACRLRSDILLIVQNVSTRRVALPYESYGGICDVSPCDRSMILVAKVPNEGYHLVGYTDNTRTCAFFNGLHLDRVIHKNKHVHQYFSLCKSERNQAHEISNSTQEDGDEDDEDFIDDDEEGDGSSQFWDAVGVLVGYFEKRYADYAKTGFQGIKLKPETLAEKEMRSDMIEELGRLLNSEEAHNKTYSEALLELHRAFTEPDEFAKTIKEPVRRSIYSKILSFLPDASAIESKESVSEPVLFPLRLDIDMQMFHKAICMFYMDDRKKVKGLQERTLFNQQLKTKARAILTSLQNFLKENKISSGQSQYKFVTLNIRKFELYTLYGLRWQALYENAAQKYFGTGMIRLAPDEEQYLQGLYLRDSRVSVSLYPVGLFTSLDIPKGIVIGSLSGRCIRNDSGSSTHAQDRDIETSVMVFSGRQALETCARVNVSVQCKEAGVLSFCICSAHSVDDVDDESEARSTDALYNTSGNTDDSEHESEAHDSEHEDELSQGEDEDINMEDKLTDTPHRNSRTSDAALVKKSGTMKSNVIIDRFGNVRTRRRLNAHEQILLFPNETLASTDVVLESERLLYQTRSN